MPVAAEHATLTVALVGNPNTGKSTLFNALAGVRQRVGNYPGVTVEKKIGHLRHEGRDFALVDLPGTYSLAPRSPDEMVAVDVLLGRRADVPPVDVVLCIVDASNLERNLYVVSQVLELGRPTVIALNMMDLARKRGMSIDAARLEQQLGVPVVETQAQRRLGVGAIKAALGRVAAQALPPRVSPFPAAFQNEVAVLEAALGESAVAAPLPRYLIERLLLDTGGYLRSTLPPSLADALDERLPAARERLAAGGCAVPAVEAVVRYQWISQVLPGVVTRDGRQLSESMSDRLDRLLTHKIWGTLLFALAMIVLFSSVFSWAVPLMSAIGAGVNAVGGLVEAAMPEGALRSLLVDGVVAGVGSVLVFLPQILILFFFMAVLEDCGYMARAAFLMDKLMSRVGLSGKSFIPLLSSFACAIPGVMATRVIENRRDRLTTILVAPLMSCSARLPVYTILIAAFVPNRHLLGGLLRLQGLTLFAMYLVGILTAVVVALVLKKTLLRGETPPFVMELPSYKWPSPSGVLYRMAERGWAFVRRAGTLILAVSVVVWAATYFPHDRQQVEAPYATQRASLQSQLEALDAAGVPKAPSPNSQLTTHNSPPPADAIAVADLQWQRQEIEGSLAAIDKSIAGDYQRQSYLGRLGHLIEPVVRPLGWDWRIGCAALASFPAREVVVGALGVIYNLGPGVEADDAQGAEQLQQRLREATWDGTDRPVFNVPVALSIMVFFALCAQCASTLVIIRRETNSWRWPLFTFAYMTTLAYFAALVTYQVGMLFI